MADEDLRALERAARSESEADCLRYWAEAIRRGRAAEIRGDVAAAVEVDRFQWAVPVLAQLRALAGEKPLKVGDWVRVVNKRVATFGCYGRVRFPSRVGAIVRLSFEPVVVVDLKTSRGLLPVSYKAASLELVVDPGLDAVLYSVAAEVKAEKRKKKPRPRDDVELDARLVEAMTARGRFGRNRA